MTSAKRIEVDVCVIGAGPAGTTLAARLAQLGHEVCLVERCEFPRKHVGESLSPGVLPLLEMTGAREAVAKAGFSPVDRILVKWEDDFLERRDPGQSGLIVDRGRFDQILLERARTLGVQLLQPATIRGRTRGASGWKLRVETPSGSVELHSTLLADAGGRSAPRRVRRRWTGCRTLALHAYWSGSTLPRVPRMEAGTDAWYWGVPLPDGTYNTFVFVDLEHVRTRNSASIAGLFHELIGRSELMAGCREARLVSRVFAVDATPYIDDDSISPSSIKVGEAALALDPLSSSGVQNAMQTALAGAVMVNTLLRKPESGHAAELFYRNNLAEASARHSRWAAGHYATAAAHRDSTFWRARAASAPPDLPAQSVFVEREVNSAGETPLELSPHISFVEQPCIDGDFVALKSVVCHPNLSHPVAYLGGWELAPLLRQLPAGLTQLEIGRYWSAHLPLDKALAITAWLLGKNVLVPQTTGVPKEPIPGEKIAHTGENDISNMNVARGQITRSANGLACEPDVSPDHPPISLH